MDIMCGAFKNFWYTIYNACVNDLSDSTKSIIGGVLIVISLLVFVLCTKGHNKAQMVNNWFLFWLSLIIFGIAICYLSIF